jgi:hypothetical protein
MRLQSSSLLCSFLLGVCAAGFAQTAPSSPSQTPPPPAQAPSAPLTLETLPNKPPQAQSGAPTLQTNVPPQEDQRTKAVKLASSQARWGKAISTPGVTVNLVEAGRAKSADGSSLITYHLQATGLPADQTMTLLHWPLNMAVKKVMDGIKVDASGVAICPEGSTGTCTQFTKPGQPIELKVSAAKGEAVRAALVAGDNKNGAATTAVPYPVVGEDKGCKLQMYLGTKDAELALVEGSGFPPTSAVMLSSVSGTDKQQISAKSDAEGHFFAAMLPWTPGNTEGDTSFSYTGTTCAVTLSFHWGKGSYHAE